MSIPFACTQCGACCRWGSAIKVFPRDLHALMDLLKISSAEDCVLRFGVIIREVHELSCEVIKFSILGLRREAGGCVFLSERGCRVHEKKPLICSLAPFSWSHWSTPAHRDYYQSHSPGFQGSVEFADEQIEGSIRREIEEWNHYLAEIEENPGQWWVLY